MSYDYYDLMATPEWEEKGTERGRYRRPLWFVQGPFRLCAPFLHALIDGREGLRRYYGLRLWAYRRLQPYASIMGAGVSVKRATRFPLRVFRALRRRVAFAISYTKSLLRWAGRKTLRTLGFSAPEPEVEFGSPQQSLGERLSRRFALDFPDRADQLQPEDVRPWAFQPGWVELFARYDIVQCYATDPIHALVAEVHPYIAFEHGTLRDFTLGNDPLHRLNALAYREADRVFITNGDCLAYAQALGLTNFVPMIHPVDVAAHERVDEEAVRAIRSELAADVVLFSPLRHDWLVKGTQIHIEALPEILETVQGRVVLVLCEWGAELDRSRELAAALGVDHAITWRQPLDRPSLISHMQAADVVLDQMALPHFGATAPQALAAGTPVVMSYDPDSTEWIVDEPAPILSALTPADVARSVREALDPEWRAAFRPRAREWVHKNHHPDRIVVEHCRAYRAVLEGDQ
jgi:glycosyltransferase involved in cell wall biosynthesis